MKVLQSIVFRLAVLGVSIAIIQILPNTFPLFIYYAIIGLYVLAYYFLRKYDLSLARLFVDFLFINFIIYGKEISSPLVYFLVFMPLINAINFSGKKSHYFILFLLTEITFYLYVKQVKDFYIVPSICLALMYLISCINYNSWKTEKDISDQVDSYYLSSERIKSHQIYKGVIDILNRYLNFKIPNGIFRLRVYIIRNNMLWLVNASELMWNRSMEVDNHVLSSLRRKRHHWTQNNEFKSYYNYINKEDLEYVFICDIKDDSDLVVSKVAFRLLHYDVLNKVFNKLSMLLNTEYQMKVVREDKFNEIKDMVLYVNQAVRVMHFIRNKMTPLSNLIAYYRNEASFSEEVREKMNGKIKKEVEQASKDLNDILMYANEVLDNSKNPFDESDIKNISIPKILIVLSEVVESVLDSRVIYDDSINIDILQSRVIHSSLIQCKILLSDWVENMRKYANKHKQISVKMEGDILLIHFENDYSVGEDYIMKLVRDINSQQKDAVLEGTNYGHGIYIMKSIANNLGITIMAKRDYSLTTNNNSLFFDIAFKTYEKEDSNI